MFGKISVGDRAPNFEALFSNGKKVSLADFKGKNVLLYFYPKDDTPGCTIEACGFRDSFINIEKTKTVILGISPDGMISHQQFIAKFNLPFELICDEDKKIARAYGVYVQKSMFGKKYMGIARSTFIIDKSGKIAKIFEKVIPAKHRKEVLDFLNTLEK